MTMLCLHYSWFISNRVAANNAQSNSALLCCHIPYWIYSTFKSGVRYCFC